MPDAAVARYLRSQDLLAETPGGWGWVVLGGANSDPGAALRRNYWPLVRILLSRYAPAAIDRISAVRLHVGESHLLPVLFIVQGANASRRTVEVVPGLSVEIRQNPDLTLEQVTEVTAGGVPIPVLSPARTLLSLTVGDVRDNRDLVLAWLRSLVVARPDLEAAYAAAPRHVLLARIGHLAADIGNRRLATQIGELLAAEHRNPVSRTHTRVGGEIVIPPYIISQPSLREPWADRFRARLARAAEVAGPITREAEIPPLSRSQVLSRARRAKLEDTYHSTTIEGYRITRDDVRAVEEGVQQRGKSPEEIERLMALQGYAQAFERTLELIGDAEVPAGARISEGDLLDLHLELWSPSIDAGILSASDLRGWRRDPVYIRGSDHVPPSPAKLPTLMRVLVDDLNGLEAGPIVRAVVAHWGFVHLHPFMDGNGRVSRLLMNWVLGAGGIPWTTIRAEERDRYFGALETAHIREDYAPFAEFIRDCVVRAAAG
ncbi:MAG TPA: Fic family protein [Longimicrobium sp.]|nr:Fic family protein [Longimicrobium sp.]